MLESTGIDKDEERVYRLLVATLDGDPALIADRLGIDVHRAHRCSSRCRPRDW